ncbi:MAG: ATP-binding protein [Lachnospiraceae bacterium]|nr:ATP-binding protein [Lachnospiraceae bacterium]
MKKISECILYRNFAEGWILEDMTGLMEQSEQEATANREANREIFYACVNGLIELAGNYGFEGNLWHNYLTFLLVNHENAFSTACEIVGPVDGSINEVALHDFRRFKELYDYDLQILGKELGSTQCSIICNYKNINDGSKMFNKRIRDRICSLSVRLEEADSVESFMEEVVQFYKDFGVGKLGLHKAFRVAHNERDEVEIVPITNIAHVHLNDLVGYEIAKKKLIDNTEAFVEGRRANNCLLFGDAGTGKSSSIKGILNEYYDQGLRIIEVYKHQFQDLNEVIAQIKNRNYKFIIYMDDLSFEEFEIEYKYLKAVIEGGLERKPDNVLIYATSNRRHLIKEEFSDKEGRRDHLHASDTVQEKLSLVARFGVTIFFSAPDKKEFQAIVRTLAERHQIEMSEEQLLLEANKWEMAHGGLSGRTAQQFIDYLLGQKK